MANLLMQSPVPYEPKRQNRFLFRFPTNLGINEWWVESSKRPTISIDETEIPFFNTSTWVAGRFIWEPMDITFRDPIGPSAAQALTEWLRLHAESVTGRMGYAFGYKKDVELEMTDPTGVVVEKWILQGAFMTNIDYGGLDYSSSELVKITTTLRADRCILIY